ncbi:HD family phosphohydrolase [Shimazuella alba]|uniref:HDIG domain-containing protein n=1 Tax=Shimazuella alba TaxID=2690964 RepID=A0A6I4VZX4_9BACL|nr:HD family phosphohydrolase [Shimazuella alba]MXQ53622.1 HDIG domain-containing protein [Shimazuella alba]
MGKSQRDSFLQGQWKTNFSIQMLIYAIFGVAFYLLLLPHALPQFVDIKVGKVSRETIISPITKIDETATKLAQDRAVESVDPQYTKNEELTNSQIEKIDLVFADARRIIADKTLTEPEKIKSLKDAITKELPEEFYYKLVRTPENELTDLRLTTRDIVSDLLEEGIRTQELASKKDQVDRMLVISSLSSNSRYLAREMARYFLIANELYDQKKTDSLKEAAKDSVDSIPIKKGQVLVSSGEVVTDDQYRKLTEMGIIREQTNFLPYVGLLLFVALILAIFRFYVQRFHSFVHADNSQLLLLISILLLTLIGMKIVTLGQNLEWSTVGFLAPVALGTMLITLLLNSKLSISASLILCVASSMFFKGDNQFLFDFRFGLIALISGIISTFALDDVKRRSAVLKAGVLTSSISMIVILALYTLTPTESDITQLFQSLLFGFIGGIFSAVLTIGFLPYFETLFGILSPLRLLELSNPNHPLLQDLLYKAPGTYHHSIIVGNLAEAAAESIGADGFLARVGAYYHDVGKLKRPQFFIENQIHRDNPHDKISPNLSKTIILSHPRDGVEMLKVHRIPKAIQDIAAQHHGTTLLKFFYYRALEQSNGTKVIEEDYRYPGPKAQFKEAAIVGIADCVEAAVRSISKPSPSRIENMIGKIIRDRLEDGQFHECDLTFKECNTIAKAMAATLQGIFHSRIEYPDDIPKGGK